jgi:hypothetical protein
MTPNDDSKTNHDYPHHTAQGDDAPAGGYRVEDDKNLEEKDLKKTYLFGDSKMQNPDTPGHESHGMGGHKFGENNVTPAGDDEFNPSRTAGYDNDYFKRKEPMEEHPENNNFRPSHQEGEPNFSGTDRAHKNQDNEKPYNSPQGNAPAQPQNQQSYQEGTVDNDGKGATHPGLRGNKEDSEDLRISPEDRYSPSAGGNTPAGQTPSSSANISEPGKANYNPDYDKGRPDYGSNTMDDEQEHIET